MFILAYLIFLLSLTIIYVINNSYGVIKSQIKIMTNRRKLKKNINFICSEMFAECIAASLYNGQPDKGNVNALLTSILKMQNDFVNRISHAEPGVTAKSYYNRLTHEFHKQVDEIIDQISNLN